ncbi:hypothetical protein AA106555_0765 [Neokomagataea thailandica NBRC 106555]|uniref:Uncharacterized protein n=2 Tax=Neokomagataea TaxID=1223423 RepID=A0A4Y6V4X2_9PROT|nr:MULTISPECIES: hypothetical protein [Neokomagataea]QDH25152.1 hypothetical protein D5366_07925 [Neokomagataea tanensis]GBR52014.1 hypothetical protein AA106555_0765 [Neokomagataea thailandica NBRC 106555]
MFLEQKTGSAPGLIFATIRQGATTRTFAVEVRKTDAGHFTALMPDHRWSVECLTEDAALLMHASVLFPTEHAQAPWLSNPHPAPRPIQPRKTSAQLQKADEVSLA